MAANGRITGAAYRGSKYVQIAHYTIIGMLYNYAALNLSTIITPEKKKRKNMLEDDLAAFYKPASEKRQRKKLNRFQ